MIPVATTPDTATYTDVYLEPKRYDDLILHLQHIKDAAGRYAYVEVGKPPVILGQLRIYREEPVVTPPAVRTATSHITTASITANVFLIGYLISAWFHGCH